MLPTVHFPEFLLCMDLETEHLHVVCFLPYKTHYGLPLIMNFLNVVNLPRLGFGALQNPARDEQTKKIREFIGKGVQLDVDSDGNVWATKLARNDVVVKGCFEPHKHCISKEVIENMGHLDLNAPMKV